MTSTKRSTSPSGMEQAWTLRDSDPDQAIELAEAADTTAFEVAVQVSVLRAFILYRHGELHDALSLMLDALVQLSETPLSVWDGRASNTAALVYSGLGLPEPAVKMLLNGQHQSQECGDDPTAFSCFHNMGVELGQMGDFDGALESYRKAEAFVEAGLDGHAFLAINRCDLHLDRGDIVEAKLTVQAGKQHWAGSTGQAGIFGLMVEARVAMAAGELDTAEGALHILRDQFGQDRAGVELPMLEARLWLQRGDLSQADAVLLANELGEECAAVQDVHLAARLVQLHAELAEARGDYQRALAIVRSGRATENQERQQSMSRVTTLIMNESTRHLKQKSVQLEAQNRQLSAAMDELRELHDQVNELALRDHLTGLHNRRYMAEHVDHLVHQHRRYGRDLSLLVFDIDNFKAINDTHLHSTGDVVLQQVATILQSSKRAGDVLCRLGGDEFVALLPETNLAGAHSMADRLHAAVRDHPWSSVVEGLTVSVSVGATTASGGDALEDLLQAADRAMYEAKSAGKNQVQASPNANN